ncbi:MAG: citrate transporter [Pseudomonas sp.]|jgi:Na+/H+ antiporter NhaD/arsenite permease-like protein|uniref:SLC13 family permease n=1 Tax=Ectopseudomonas guguanensis TaxID=1198456 RepID=UPI0012D64610|nr:MULTISPECIES: SLC13 family permease [Pseudomonas]MPT20910.1 citrate transporter [Pseudomonas sp.]WJH58477.1 citrate transporter [Pseudomonas guguanensis]
MTFAAWLTVGLFVFTYLGMAAGGVRGLRIDRSWIACFATVLLLVSGALSMDDAAHHLDPGALLLLLALMLISAQFDFSGVYAWLNRYLTEHAERPAVLLLGVVMLGGLLSAVLVNDIVAFALTPLLCRSLHLRGLEPRPFLLALALSCNAGSAASLIGNPQNILIGQAGGLDFWGYVAVAGPPALAAMAIVYAVIWLQWRQRWGEARPLLAGEAAVELIHGARSYIKPLLASLALLALFATALPRELSALLIAVLVMVSRRVDSRDYVSKVDWNLLLLFVGLFLVSGAALQLPQLAQGAAWLAEHGLLPQGVISLASVSLVAGNLIGNVPFVVLLLGLMPELSHSVLIGLAVMSTLAGNLLLIGSVVNLIVAEGAKRQGVRIGFVDYARSGVPVTLLSMTVAGLWLALGGWLPW